MNIPGYRTNRRILVIESDDWGSIRMPSKAIYDKFLTNGFDIAKSDFNKIDSIESNDDLISLFDALYAFKDINGNSPVITANCVVGNPDFNKIRESGFQQYFFEPVTETLKRYPNRQMVENLWKQGNSEKIFHPQFHGREHVNVVRWMDALKKKSPGIIFTFENGTTFSGKGDYNFMEVLDFNTLDDLIKMKLSLAEGLDLFEGIFGFQSRSFIPPCYTWHSEIEETLHEKGVKYIQGLAVQLIPTGTFGNYKRKYHFLGNQNSMGQIFLVRNCFFEPSLVKTHNAIDECLKRIKIAFRWNKPAIISSHRINFIGSIIEKNRTENISLFRELLRQIIKHWPDVEFMTSDQLGDIIKHNNKL